MERLIDANALIPLIKMGECNMYDEYCQGRNGGIQFAIEQINQMPTIEPKKGKWRKLPMACYGGGTVTEYQCPFCGEQFIMASNFCQECGADLRGAEP